MITYEQVAAYIAASPETRIIPTLEGEPNYSMRLRLDGKDYNFTFRWNERLARWAMSIFDDDQVPLALGIPIVSNWPMLRFYQWDKRLPPGELFAIDTTNDGSPPGFYDLAPDKRVQLIYLPISEL